MTTKDLTQNAVQYATLLLIEANGSTTTLEVKKCLRSLGFFAEQVEVSAMVNAVAQSIPLNSDRNGFGWLDYSLPEIDDVIDDDNTVTTVATAVVSTTVGGTYTKRNGVLIHGYDDSWYASDKHWSVTDADNRAPIMYFNDDLTRDEVRQAYAAIKGVPFADTRSMLVG